MKEQYFGNHTRVWRGVSTLEILIAFAVTTLSISAIILLVFGNQSVAIDTQTNTEALSKAQALLESTRALARKDYLSVNSIAPYSWTPPGGLTYSTSTTVTDLTQCKKQATTTVSWKDGNRDLSISLSTYLGNGVGILALGGDCDVDPPDGWRKPRLFDSFKFNPGQPVSLDVLKKIAYVSDDKNKLNIVDTSVGFLGYSGDFLTPPFDATSTLNDLDAAKWTDPVTGTQKIYVYGARGHIGCNVVDNTEQLHVIDVTNPATPVYKRSMTLKGSTPPSGSCPGGWRVFYYDNRVYVTTRETAGNEFHIFDVTDPTMPLELGPGFQLNGTTNDLVATGINIGGLGRKVVFLATDRSTKEVMVLDVTVPSNPRLITSVDLGTTNNALSIYLVGNKLYVGRQKTVGEPELLIYSVTYGVDGTGNLTVSLSQIGPGGEINADVKNLRISGALAFMATNVSNDEFQVWGINNPSSITRVDTLPINLPNKIVGGMDYEAPYIYVGSQATNPLQVLYSAP